MELKLARLGSVRYRTALRRAVRSALEGRGQTDGQVTDEEYVRCRDRAMGETVLVGWRGIVEDDGVTPLAWTADRATEILSDPRQFALREFVVETAASLDSYRIEELGNSGAGSGGS